MGKCMRPCLCIAHVYLDGIVLRFGFYLNENGCMDMFGVSLICYNVKYMA